MICASCLCPDAGTPCKECGFTQIRHAPGARLGPLVRTPRTPLAELARQERLLTAALLELGALESGERVERSFPAAHHWVTEAGRRIVADRRAKRDLAALSLDRDVVDAQLSELPRTWRPRVERDAGPSMEVV